MADGPSHRFDIVVVGSGFAGSILARLLAAAGRSVLLVERGRHPRFALGESSTPLAAIALERLARRPELAVDGGDPAKDLERDLAALAAAGRWSRDLDPPAVSDGTGGSGGSDGGGGSARSEGNGESAGSGRRVLRRGLKRGFTFYQHRRGRPWANSAANDARLLVAASPVDAIADSHWLRADVDHHLVCRAVEAGAVLWEGCELDGVRIADGGAGPGDPGTGDGPVRLTGRRRGGSGRGGTETGGVGGPGDDPGDGRSGGGETPRVGTAGVGQPGGGSAPARGGASEATEHGRVARDGERFTVEAGFVVDASGPGGFLARHLPIPEVEPGTPDTALVYGHFEGVRRFAGAARSGGASLPPGPYPDDRAAVHHYLDEGWMYALRFDPEDGDGGALTSAGFVLRREAADALAGLEPEAAFAALLARYPTLAATFAGARPVRPVARLQRLPHRLSRAAGRRWLLLPHAYAFFDPLFSTGMAWSLVGVERAADLLLGRDGVPDPGHLAAYDRLLAAEADQVADLVAGAWAALGDFRRAAAHAQLYFAAASFQEAKQRLTDGDHPWDGFLGATDPVLRRIVAEARERLERWRSPGPAEADDAEATGATGATEVFERWIATAIAPRNLAGLADPRRRNLYPVDLEALVTAAPLLGLTEDEVRTALPRLRGGDAALG